MVDLYQGTSFFRRVFVYETLKRGQCREVCWPAKPLSIHDAEVSGVLYDLGPFPGLREGVGRVSGEVWEFAPDDMPAVLAALDAIEGYSNSPSDLYRRVAKSVSLGNQEAIAWTYVLCCVPAGSPRVATVPATWPGKCPRISCDDQYDRGVIHG